jgi:hypothetical protein
MNEESKTRALSMGMSYPYIPELTQSAVLPTLEEFRTLHMKLNEGAPLFPGGSGQSRSVAPKTVIIQSKGTGSDHKTEHGEYRTFHACLNTLDQMGITDYTVHRPMRQPDQSIHPTTVGEGNFVGVDVGEPYNVRLIFQSEQSNVAYVLNLADVVADGSDLRSAQNLSQYLGSHSNFPIYFHSGTQFMHVVGHALRGHDLYLPTRPAAPAPDGAPPAPDAGPTVPVPSPSPETFIQTHEPILREAMTMICDAANALPKTKKIQAPETMSWAHVRKVDSGEAGIRSGRAFLEICARGMGRAIGRADRTNAQEYALEMLQFRLYGTPLRKFAATQASEPAAETDLPGGDAV